MVSRFSWPRMRWIEPIDTLARSKTEAPKCRRAWEAEVLHPSLCTQGGHELFALLVGAFHEPSGFAAPMPVPEDPGLGFCRGLSAA